LVIEKAIPCDFSTGNYGVIGNPLPTGGADETEPEFRSRRPDFCASQIGSGPAITTLPSVSCQRRAGAADDGIFREAHSISAEQIASYTKQ